MTDDRRNLSRRDVQNWLVGAFWVGYMLGIGSGFLIAWIGTVLQ